MAQIEIEALTLRMASRMVRELSLPEAASRLPSTGEHRGAASAMAASSRITPPTTSRSAASPRTCTFTPQYAMTAFRAAPGSRSATTSTQCRVAVAQQLLLTTDMPVPDVGFASGFRSQSQFYDRFARHCGEPPGAYRRRLQGG